MIKAITCIVVRMPQASWRVIIGTETANPIDLKQNIQRYIKQGTFSYRSCIQSVGPLRALHPPPPPADLFIPAPTRLLWEACYLLSNYARRLITPISTHVSFTCPSALGHCGENENAQTSRRYRTGILSRVLSIARPAF